jgi:FkbM family methyltransferase
MEKKIINYKIIIYNFIKKIFSYVGLEIRFKKNLNFDEIYKKYIKKNPVIIDVGANEGQSIKRFDLIFNNCVIHSFEPIKKCFDKMVKDHPNKKNIKNNYALSDKNTNKIFFINKHSYTSGFNRINKSYDQLHEKDKTRNNIKVKTIKLDTYVDLNKIKKIDILKIDTQGHELDVLKGAKNSLKKNIFNFVEVEIILCDYYTKKISLHKIDRVMCENNFDLFNFQEFAYSKDYQIKWFDMLYINKKFKQKLASTKSIANNF